LSLIAIILTAIGLSMDAFAVSITEGLSLKRQYIRTAFMFGLFFGGFQALMPVLGWTAGSLFKNFPIASWDHWIAFTLLTFIGGKMIWESRILEEESEKDENNHSFMIMTGLAIATSIDALAVGISLSFLNVNIITPAILIGCITFAFSFVGIFVGKLAGGFLANKAELVGGLVLIGIGLKILFEHTLF
jgi:putative Mn2+ efflux pump MntP